MVSVFCGVIFIQVIGLTGVFAIGYAQVEVAVAIEIAECATVGPILVDGWRLGEVADEGAIAVVEEEEVFPETAVEGIGGKQVQVAVDVDPVYAAGIAGHGDYGRVQYFGENRGVTPEKRRCGVLRVGAAVRAQVVSWPAAAGENGFICIGNQIIIGCIRVSAVYGGGAGFQDKSGGVAKGGVGRNSTRASRIIFHAVVCQHNLASGLRNLFADIFDCILATATALVIRLVYRQQASRVREEQLRTEKLKVELQALKSQIHPHFLFNTINNLYALARVRSEKTAAVALQLAGLLRYVLYESAKAEVSLAQELQNLQDYVELEKLRFDEDRLQVNMQIEVDDPAQSISPLLLLPLVENAFKHGVNEKRYEAWVRLSVVLKNKVLSVDVENAKEKETPVSPEGIGLRNLQRQLELLYPGRHRLVLQDDGDTFKASLKLELQT